eukprot:scaffold201740_cov31-Tisochrysis_lutea.AAC.6
MSRQGCEAVVSPSATWPGLFLAEKHPASSQELLEASLVFFGANKHVSVHLVLHHFLCLGAVVRSNDHHASSKVFYILFCHLQGGRAAREKVRVIEVLAKREV